MTDVNLSPKVQMNGRSQNPNQKPHYHLSTVRELVNEGRVEIQERARQNAMACFGWRKDDILRAFKRLRLVDFYKTEPKYDSLQGVMVDYYKAQNLMGEKVYIHFRVDRRCDGNILVICSFKRI